MKCFRDNTNNMFVLTTVDSCPSSSKVSRVAKFTADIVLDQNGEASLPGAVSTQGCFLDWLVNFSERN